MLASGIARANPARSLAEVELAARKALQTLVFREMCRQVGLLGHAGLDALAGKADPANLQIDAEKLPEVVCRLAAADSALRRASWPVEWLGAIHEHLVGRKLSDDRAGRFRVESGPEGKRQGGVFYTPDCVTEYIVSNSLGPRLEGLGPDAIGRLEPAILDPACGCGAFLLAACRHLLRWCTERHVPDAARLVARLLHGVDLDPEAVLAARRSLWLEMMTRHCRRERRNGSTQEVRARQLADQLTENIRCGDVLAGPVPWRPPRRFDAVVGNPPYRRELNSKDLLDSIARTELGRRYRAPRMDLWYYFVHRSLEWLKPGGGLGFIVGSYWTSARGATKLLAALRESAQVEEIFLLDRLKVFRQVSGRHMILRLTKGAGARPTTIKRASATSQGDAEPYLRGTAPVVRFEKTADQLFRHGRIDLEPPCDELLSKLARWTPLSALGKIRQGIVENPATVTRKTNQQHGSAWSPGEGVFTLRPDELVRLNVPQGERRLLRPYHDLCDLGRYFLAEEPSLALIYATPQTCPDIDRYPALRAHLARFRPIMEARRETRAGARRWCHLHWPRDEELWKSRKIVSLQMARRPAFVPATSPVYVPFSTNVFVPHAHTGEHLHYVTALLNSRLLWKWYRHHAKRRGVGLEINGHVLAQTPIRTIDFSKPREKASHDRLVSLVDETLRLNRRLREAPAEERTAIDERIARIDGQIDSVVYGLYEATEAAWSTSGVAEKDPIS
jgi:methylase of polypeptide subunit release factors